MPSVLITGASQGSGKATALRFARQGYDVVLAARQADRLQTVAKDISALGRRAVAIPTDVGQLEQVTALVHHALEQLGAIDVLINNAGICLTGTMAQTSIDDWQQLMNTNFWGYVYTIQALLPHFLAQGRGTIVNVGSFGGKMPLPYMTAYCASKYAVTGLTETLRLELQPRGIHVAAVHPGVINSSFMERAMFRGQDDQETQSRQSQMQSALKGAWVSQPEDIANAIWEAVTKQRAEIIVGPVAIATEVYRLAPGLAQWMLSQSTR
ncbi:SDR family NAD(P)-dependent oxidoreductase [Thermocoleostomius sinensis]|jgi:short-subunit dehydrogenase|uniref:SDR family NAD(P)-dependent oxidoreductase n=1 Tax=Thermocoleostomius sinensis A174 TaxID=2016057 RepID=A0A9E8ZF25_9CYAN|nr:SDR family oxidoreductase [Thermocoleostomius sinensis]WAL62185.1 SDR family NAD(P)-dependent oxidoreductase [Thermocoleostomius sinensis A174]